jgi:hypothetical protein
LFRGELRRAFAGLCAAALLCAPVVRADRTQLKPGWNLFSPKDDIAIGLSNAKEAEQQLPILHDRKVEDYLNSLGKRLSGYAPGEKYPYQFKCVNTREINAFALPGGFVYVNRGTIEAADDEAQLAAVIGHEISHVALRHGTNQVTKAYGAQLPLAVLGGVLGNTAMGQVIAAIGSFAANSVLLKYSRADESQADILGTQIAYDAGYDPRALAQFFEKLDAVEKKNGAPLEFFSNHPSPEHRIERVTQEIENLGGPSKSAKTDSSDFHDIKRYLLALPAPPKQDPAATTAPVWQSRPGQAPEAPSTQLQSYETSTVTLQFPSNWHASGSGSAALLAPDNGMMDDGHGGQAVAYGVIVNMFQPSAGADGSVSLEAATNQLIEVLHQSNSGLSVQRRAEAMRLSGQRALSAYLLNDSPAGKRELIWLVTSQRPDGLLYIVCTAPQKDYDRYSKAFDAVMRSIHFRE